MRLAIFLTLLSAPLHAQSLDGTYHWTGSDPATACDTTVYNDGRITIAGNRISFVESQCKLDAPVSVRDMPEGTLYDATCTGEGEIWTERMFVYRTFAGVAVLSRGAARTYTRCE